MSMSFEDHYEDVGDKNKNTSYFIITIDRKINDVLLKIDCYVKIQKMKDDKISIEYSYLNKS